MTGATAWSGGARLSIRLERLIVPPYRIASTRRGGVRNKRCRFFLSFAFSQQAAPRRPSGFARFPIAIDDASPGEQADITKRPMACVADDGRGSYYEQLPS
jgi:hypothetical protein